MTDIATVTRIPRAATLRKQEAILAEAERQYSESTHETGSLTEHSISQLICRCLFNH